MQRSLRCSHIDWHVQNITQCEGLLTRTKAEVQSFSPRASSFCKCGSITVQAMSMVPFKFYGAQSSDISGHVWESLAATYLWHKTELSWRLSQVIFQSEKSRFVASRLFCQWSGKFPGKPHNPHGSVDFLPCLTWIGLDTSPQDEPFGWMHPCSHRRWDWGTRSALRLFKVLMICASLSLLRRHCQSRLADWIH